MSDLRQAAQQALEAWQTSCYGAQAHQKAMLIAMTYLNSALEQQPLDERKAADFLDAADVMSTPYGVITFVRAAAQQGEPSDLVKRLRETASKGVSVWGDLQMEAAKEIEILTAERELYASAMDRMKTALAQQVEPHIAWRDMYYAAKRVSEMWKEKYESIGGKVEYAVPQGEKKC